MKNQSIKNPKNAEIKKESNAINSKNADAIKFDLSKGDKSLLNKESKKKSSSSLYKEEIFKGMDSDQRKNKRNKLRNQLKNFRNDILGKDRKEDERIESIKSFMEFYKENWILQDLKIESFSNAKNDREDNIQLLNYLKSIMQ